MAGPFRPRSRACVDGFTSQAARPCVCTGLELTRRQVTARGVPPHFGGARSRCRIQKPDGLMANPGKRFNQDMAKATSGSLTVSTAINVQPSTE